MHRNNEGPMLDEGFNIVLFNISSALLLLVSKVFLTRSEKKISFPWIRCEEKKKHALPGRFCGSCKRVNHVHLAAVIVPQLLRDGNDHIYGWVDGSALKMGI